MIYCGGENVSNRKKKDAQSVGMVKELFKLQGRDFDEWKSENIEKQALALMENKNAELADLIVEKACENLVTRMKKLKI